MTCAQRHQMGRAINHKPTTARKHTARILPPPVMTGIDVLTCAGMTSIDADELAPLAVSVTVTVCCPTVRRIVIPVK
jgi:hypothetical protein